MNIIVYKCFVLKINDINLKLYDNRKNIMKKLKIWKKTRKTKKIKKEKEQNKKIKLIKKTKTRF